MNIDKIKDVLSENLGEGFKIVDENDENDENDGMTAAIEWVDWVQLSDDENDIQIEVYFEDDSKKIFPKGLKLRQIWHEDS
ncbi:hypothetical protein [Enterovibrio norvegicus]|uniref:Uncharacterized protein n=1 Tax=Enterovibrio norvegicus DSM 15893 TaxID=1121869 RepID=A0A1I5XV37_9GAMM|nr:hypothetical protein [Enterovibrio norvegicus]SFQ35587.1 hypothetical protein SAMN03084138_04838 [Enterovibrio norvegicus DSM 15893]